MSQMTPLVDTFGRLHDNLRLSVTDRCNIRCFYCMPEDGVKFQPREQLLSFEEIERFVRVAVTLGVRKLRITGGEPLLRKDLPQLIRMLAAIDGIEDMALTTNGVLLRAQAQELYDAGLRRINVHLDTLDRERFKTITRRDDFGKVMEGIEICRRLGYGPIKINAVAVKNLVEPDIVPLARFGRERDIRNSLHRVHAARLRRACGSAIASCLADDMIAMLSARNRAARRSPRSRPARARHRISLRRWNWPRRLHRLRQPAVLSELQSHPADCRRQAPLLPVRHRRNGHTPGHKRRRIGRRYSRRGSRFGPREVDRTRN